LPQRLDLSKNQTAFTIEAGNDIHIDKFIGAALIIMTGKVFRLSKPASLPKGYL
jgi:hypothetical protein